MGNCLGRCLAGKTGIRHEYDEAEQLVGNDDEGDHFIFKIIKFRSKKPSRFLDKFWERQCQSYSPLTKEGIVSDNPEIQLQCLDAQTLMLSTREAPMISMHYKTTAGNPECGVLSSSRASSSLDLEWENEYEGSSNTANITQSHSWFFLQEAEAKKAAEQVQDVAESIVNTDDIVEPIETETEPELELEPEPEVPAIDPAAEDEVTIVRNSSKSSWSHISTPDSLEWDVDEEQQKSLIVEDDMLDHDTLQLLHEIEQLKNKVLEETGTGLDFEVIRKLQES